MPYRRSNYDFVIDSSFTPFTMQEMLVPFTAYKEAYEQDQAAYEDLTTKADVFKDLSQSLPEGSKARRIYEGYANDLKTQADNLTQNGLTMSGRSALRNLKRRYSGEIGMLDRANEALKKEMELRRQMSAKDPSMLYAVNNLTIDNYLEGQTPNLYGISGNELYAKGAAAGKAASSRLYSNPEVRNLDKYYNEYFNTVGYSPEKMQEFRDRLSAIPELQKAALDIVKANRVGELGEGSANYNAALQQIVNGIADGAIYQRQSNMQRNLGVMTAAEQASDARARESQAIQRANLNESIRQHDMQLKIAGYDKNGVYHPELDQTVAKAKAIAEAKNAGKGAGGKGGGTERQTVAQDRIVFEWSGNPKDTDFDADNPSVATVGKDEKSHPGSIIKYEDLPDYAKRIAMKKVGRGNAKYYDYYFEDYNDDFGPWNTQVKLEMVPRKIVVDNKQDTGVDYSGIEGDSDLE